MCICVCSLTHRFSGFISPQDPEAKACVFPPEENVLFLRVWYWKNKQICLCASMSLRYKGDTLIAMQIYYRWSKRLLLSKSTHTFTKLSFANDKFLIQNEHTCSIDSTRILQLLLVLHLHICVMKRLQMGEVSNAVPRPVPTLTVRRSLGQAVSMSRMLTSPHREQHNVNHRCLAWSI